MKKLFGIILALSLLVPTQVKADKETDAVVAGAVILGIAGIIAAQAQRDRNRDRHYHHYYTPPPEPPRMIYREYHPSYHHPRYHHHHHYHPHYR
jgi:hypothetical protein